MSTNNTNPGGLIVKTGLLILGAAMLIMAAGILRAESSSGEKEPAASSGKNKVQRARTKQNYVLGEVIVKLRDDQSNGISLLSQSGSATEMRDKIILSRLETEYGVYEEGSIFTGAQEQQESQTRGQISLASAAKPKARSTRGKLSRCYLLKTAEKVQGICARLNEDSEVEYAQPNYIYKSCSDPNDPEFPDQYAHQLIQMADAWDISTGSRDVVVAVMDTGVDINHPDLKDNIWINTGEIPNNDIDDDENGFVDDIHGWNFENDSNEVTPDSFDFWDIGGHGTNVAGVIEWPCG